MSKFECPPEHKESLEAVKQAVGVGHGYLDNWIYLFLYNKNMNVAETVAKLQRRDAMEKTVFSQYTLTASLRESMRAGIVQFVGGDKDGRPVLYFNTVRDCPTTDQRPERQANLDMFLSWAARCDPANTTSTVTWLINQQDASMMRNTDLVFQKDMALRISKFFPGVVGRVYICNMGSALTFVMKPLLKQLPRAISDCIHLFSGSDIRKGKLLEFMDASVLPIALGGKNDCDNKDNYEYFAQSVEKYFDRCIVALKKDISMKEMEMMEVYGVDKHGQPLAIPKPPPLAKNIAEERRSIPTNGASASVRASVMVGQDAEDDEAGEKGLFAASLHSALRVQRIQEAAEETLDMADLPLEKCSSIRVDRRGNTIVVMSRALQKESNSTDDDDDDVDDLETVNSAVLGMEEDHILSPSSRLELQREQMAFYEMSADSISSLAYGGGGCKLPDLKRVQYITDYSFRANVPHMRLTSEQTWELQRNWAKFLGHCIEMCTHLSAVMANLRDGLLPDAQLVLLRDNTSALRKIAHYALNLFPQTHQRLSYPIMRWFLEGARWHRRISKRRHVVDKCTYDCTSPDNFLLSLQGIAVQVTDDCDSLVAQDRRQDHIIRRIRAAWSGSNGGTPLSRESLLAKMEAKVYDLWQQLVPIFQKYIEAKVAMSIGEFIGHYELLVKGGRINTDEQWYTSLFTSLVQHREIHRRNWLFYVFPPLFRENEMRDEPPPLGDILSSQRRELTMEAVCAFNLLVEESVCNTREAISQDHSVVKVVSHTVVENYLETTASKIYIPYESQRDGFTPAQLVEAERVSMVKLLDEMEAPLREFLRISTMIFTVTTVLPQQYGYAECMQALSRMQRQCAEAVQARTLIGQAVAAMGRTAYNMQGSFGTDYLSVLPVALDGSPDGYGVALALLFVEGYLSSTATRHPSELSPFVREGSTPTANASLSSVPEFDATTGELSASEPQSPFSDCFSPQSVPLLLESLRAMDICATPIAGIKRLLIP